MNGKHRTKQRTLGLLGTDLITFMQNQLWQGAMSAAQQGGARLIHYPAISLSSTPPFNPQPKVILDLIDSEHLDGLLIWYAGVAEGIGIEQGAHFFDRYSSLPIVTVGGQLENYPDLSVDNYYGARAVIEHLIEVHGRRHIGVIRGPTGHPDADDRYRAYRETLQAYGLHANPYHRAESPFALQFAPEATQSAINQWLQDSSQNLDAVVAASDYIALAAIEALESHGLRVPDDIAVVGFDNVNDGKACIPSLTTVHQPFFEQGYQGTEMLLALIDGQSLPAQSIMTSRLVVRESCGCLAKSLLLANPMTAADQPARPDAVIVSRERLPDPVTSIAQESGIPADQVESLFTLLQKDLLSGTSHHFLPRLRQSLIDTTESQLDVTQWQNAISAFRKYTLSISNGDDIALWVETLFNQARVLVTEIFQRSAIKQRLSVEQQIDNLRRTSEALITSFGSQLLVDTLHNQLPTLGFPSFYLSLYDDPEQPAEWARLLLACHKNQRLDLPSEGVRFRARQLIPNSLFPPQHIAQWVIEPLYFREEQLGILVLEAGPTEGGVYENIRAQVSSALQGSRLLQQVRNHAAQLEQRVSVRTEELSRTVERLQLEIAERKRMEESLRLVNFAIERASDAVYWINSHGYIVDVNESACQMLGYLREELVGTPLNQIDPTVESYDWPTHWKMVKKGGLPPLETAHLKKDGRKIAVEIQANYIAFEGKEFNCAFARDITQRKEAEEALRQSEEHTREFQEKLMILHEVSLELVAAQSIEELCTRAIALGHSDLGYDRIGILLFENTEQSKVSRYGIESNGELRIEHGMDYDVKNDKVIAPMLTNQESVFISEDAKLSDFEEVVGRGWNVITGIWDGTTSIGWLAADNFFGRKPLIPYQVELLKLYGLTIGHLVTRKRAEAAIRTLNDELEQRVIQRTAQLEASNQELESFAYVVSHDLKAPLRAISQLTNWLRTDYGGAFDEEGQHMLDLLTKRTHRMHDLIEGILHYSRIGRVKEQKYRLDLNQLVHDVIDMLAPPPSIQVSVGTSLPTVYGDQTRLEQVFQNLIGNSIKFMDKAAGQIIVNCQDMQDQWLFSVSDNGPGIESKYHEKIFQIFQTLDPHDKHEGTGIGLALVKKSVERWGGKIWVESIVDQGATFFFTIPKDQADAGQ